MLELNHVSRSFGGLQALQDVNMLVPHNQVIGLIGPNGAGKSTLINNISGLDHPTGGEIRFLDKAIHRKAPHQITKLGIARTYQNIRLFSDMTVLENLLIGQHARGHSSVLDSVFFLPRFRNEERQLRDNALALLERFHLSMLAETRAGNLPYGDQRRLEMARRSAA